MIGWLQSAGKSLSNLVEETITEEDSKERSNRAFTLAPLQAHFGVLKNKPKPLFHILPVELKLYIFSFLPPEDLINSVCIVCREWMKLANDDRSWAWRFQREFYQWDTYGFHPKFMNTLSFEKNYARDVAGGRSMPTLPTHFFSEKKEIVSERMTWKQWYLQQYLHNSKLYHSPERALRKIMSRQFEERSYVRNASPTSALSISLRLPGQHSRNSPRRQIFRIPIFGQAMESSASGLLYNLMWSQESPLLVTGLYPGTDGIGSGVGFKVNSKRLNLAAIYGENPLDMPQWRRFFENADAMIYVVDSLISDENLKLAKEELATALRTNARSPLVIFCCDDPAEVSVASGSQIKKRLPFEIATEFEVKEQGNRKWCAKSVRSVADICGGLDWLSSIL